MSKKVEFVGSDGKIDILSISKTVLNVLEGKLIYRIHLKPLLSSVKLSFWEFLLNWILMFEDLKIVDLDLGVDLVLYIVNLFVTDVVLLNVVFVGRRVIWWLL